VNIRQIIAIREGFRTGVMAGDQFRESGGEGIFGNIWR
jgi:hypothetical protein